MTPAEPAGRAIADRDIVLWRKPQKDGVPDLKDLARRLRACGRNARVADPDRDFPSADPLSELVLVAGGDGTVATAARRLSRSGVPLAILPCGTANNISDWRGIARTEDTATVLSGEAQLIDLGLAQGPWGERVFVESLGAGAIAAAERSQHEAAERRGGYGPEGKIDSGRRAIATALAHPSPLDGEVRSPDGCAFPEPLVFVEICNFGRIGPALLLAPQADASDGTFDVVLGDLPVAEAVRCSCGEGGWPARVEPRPPAHRRRRIELTCRLRDLRIDGKFGTEILGASARDERCHDVNVEVLPAALGVVAPEAGARGVGEARGRG